MANRCEICDKGRLVGNKVSHSNIKSKKVQRPNLQRVRAKVGSTVQRIRVCTRCLRSGNRGARWFLIAWSLLLVGVAVLAFRNLGWLPTNFVTTYGMLIGSALEMLMLSFALADRINYLQIEIGRAHV